jgi:hypothetical protein
MNNIKTEPSSHDNDDHDDMAFSSSSSSMINTATTSIYVKKKDEDHDDGNDDFNPITSSSPISSCSHGRLYRQVKKEEEEEEEEKEDEGSSSSSPEATATPASSSASPRIVVKKEEEENNGSKNEDDDDDYYADWKVGNWCWVLPSTTTTCNDDGTTTQRRQIQQNNHSIKSEVDGDLNTNIDAPSTVSSRKRTTRSRNTSTLNEDTSRKKMRLLPPPSHRPLNTNTNNVTVKREKDSGCDEEVSNPNITDSNDSGSGSNKADDDGYESWTEGNWCLLLPTVSNTSTTVKISNEQQHSSKKSHTNTERHKQPVRAKHRNCCTSSQTSLCVDDPDPDENNEFDIDYSCNDDCDKLKKSRTGRNKTITYRKAQNKKWNEMFQRLISYKKQHNSTIVPQYYAADPELGNWVKWQRHNYIIEKISDYRIDRLKSIGFVWNTLDNQWDKNFNRLVMYKNQHGSTLVPSKHKAKADTQLGKWVDTQRLHYKREILVADRIKRLELIGFVWDVHEMKWMKMYDRLVAYKKKYKTAQVPFCYTEENQLTCLGYWVYKQRSYYRDGKLLKKRVKCLNSIDFEWEAKK